MSYVLDDYVEAGYVVPYSVTVTGVSRSILISAVNILNVATSIANPLGVSKSRTTNSIPHASSTATPSGLLVKRKLGGVNANVRHPGMSIDFVQFTPPSLAPIVPHNNAGEEIAGLITPYIPPVVPLVNYTGSLGELTHILPYFSEPTSVIYNQEIEQVWGYEVTTLPGDRVLPFGSIQVDTRLEVIIYNKRLDPITLTGGFAPKFGCVVEGLSVGTSIPGNSFLKVYIKAVHILGDKEVLDWGYLPFDKVSLRFYISIKRQPINILAIIPNKNSYKESYSYRTSIFKSSNLKEKRISYLKQPKIAMSFGMTIQDATIFNLIQNYLYKGLFDSLGVVQPLWAFATKTTSAVSGTNILPCDSFYLFDLFREGDFCGIIINNSEVLFSVVLEKKVGSLKISDELSLPSGTIILPVRICKPSQRHTNTYTGMTNQQLSLSLEEL